VHSRRSQPSLNLILKPLPEQLCRFFGHRQGLPVVLETSLQIQAPLNEACTPVRRAIATGNRGSIKPGTLACRW
jgi:hypothetical protein